MKHLIIVESPAKARTIKNFLSKDYDVIASKGHIRDLPKSSFGITVDEEGIFVPKYSIAKENNATVKSIKELAKKADTIYIATDEDREGEAIGWHIAHAIKKDPEELPRIVFHEITQKAILHALENPRKIDMPQVNAQQTRRLLDRIVGYKLSPLLASKIQKGLSGGRVQSSTLKIIIDREKEILAFIPVEYWSIDTVFAPGMEATLQKFEGQKIDKLTITNEDDAKAILHAIKKESFTLQNIEHKNRKTSTPPPFMTSTLQQTASSSLGFSPKRTMMIAQGLYEGVKTDAGTTGLITYMRTDSLNIAAEAIEAVRAEILSRFGEKYLPTSSKTYNKKSKGAQEAHEAIRPTMLDFTPQKAAAYLKPEDLKLYTLIYNRFMASQMEDAQFELQTLIISSTKAEYKVNGRKLVFDGFYKVMGTDDKDKLLPDLKEGTSMEMVSADAIQHFTEPPSRYSEASLIKVLESLGIGRPSTYAPTISTLQARHYIDIEKRQIQPQEVAFKVITLLEEHFENIIDANFTANMEESLDLIAEDQESWQKVLTDFYQPFMDKIAEGKEKIKSQKLAEPTGRNCPKCNEELLLRSGRYGNFIACSGFPKCKYTEAIDEDGNTVPNESKDEVSDQVCDKCGEPMVIKNGRNGKFLACSGYPKCKSTKPLEAPTPLETPCPDCGGNLFERRSKRGNFFGCENYPTCKFISKFPLTKFKCKEDDCDGILVARNFRGKDVHECLKCKNRIELED